MTDRSVRLSVIVPLYNKARYIRRCLDSILGQTFADFEIIVVDDGSTDEGPEIVQGYTDPRLQLLRQPNAGPGAARNRGAREAQGDLLGFLDSDDEWDPVYLAESVRLLDAFGDNVALLTWAMLELPSGYSTALRWKKIGIPDGRFRAVSEGQAELVAGMLSNMLPLFNRRAPADIRSDGRILRKGPLLVRRGRLLVVEDSVALRRGLLRAAPVLALSGRVGVEHELEGHPAGGAVFDR